MADAVVIDTDVLSFFIRADTRGERYVVAIRGKTTVVSFQSVAELERGALLRNWGLPRRARMNGLIANAVIDGYSWELARLWAQLMVYAQSQGRVLHVGDAWIAAAAILRGIPLATHNRKDFEYLPGLELISAS